MTVLVTGGAGYIGSHTVRLLRERGREVVVLDSLELGHRAAVLDAPLVVGAPHLSHPVDFAELTSRAVEAMRPTAVEKGVTLEVVADHPPMVRGDGNRLTQVLDNLVSNAVKFTNDGGAVNVSVSAEGGDVRLVVADTGI